MFQDLIQDTMLYYHSFHISIVFDFPDSFEEYWLGILQNV
jgi:hypothetical protein